MVRKGSPVRVRKRALQEPAASGGFRRSSAASVVGTWAAMEAFGSAWRIPTLLPSSADCRRGWPLALIGETIGVTGDTRRPGSTRGGPLGWESAADRSFRRHQCVRRPSARRAVRVPAARRAVLRPRRRVRRVGGADSASGWPAGRRLGRACRCRCRAGRSRQRIGRTAHRWSAAEGVTRASASRARGLARRRYAAAPDFSSGRTTLRGLLLKRRRPRSSASRWSSARRRSTSAASSPAAVSSAKRSRRSRAR
jgi:hypothetical protein